MTFRVGYEIRKTNFLLWKDHAHPALKALLGILVFLILTGIAALLLWKIAL